jgi:hypothetical protein
MLKTPPSTINVNTWNNEVQQLGYGKTESPGQNEVRVILENSRYFLKLWNGSSWVYVSEAMGFIQSGAVTQANAVWLPITFARAFSYIPKVTTSTSNGSCNVRNITTSSFELYVGSSGVTVNYIAV